MACDGSYTVVIVPLQNSVDSLDALHFFQWLKRLWALEREKDSLWSGLEVLNQARFWYHNKLKTISYQHTKIGTGRQKENKEIRSCALRSHLLRVNGSLGNLLNNTYMWSSAAPDEKNGSDWDMRWTNAILTQELSQKNQQISVLEVERDFLLQQRDALYYF